jgi:hypothetical protein
VGARGSNNLFSIKKVLDYCKKKSNNTENCPKCFKPSLFLLLLVLGFEFRASHLQAGTLPSEPYLQPFLLYLFLNRVTQFLSGEPLPMQSTYLCLPVVGITGMHQYSCFIYCKYNEIKLSVSIA